MKPVNELIRYAIDPSGHEHASAGRPEGGQFTKSAGQLASSLSAEKPEVQRKPASMDAGNQAVASVKAYLDGINQGNVSVALVEKALEPLANVPMDQLSSVAQALGIAGRVKSRKALTEHLRQVLNNQSQMWVKTQFSETTIFKHPDELAKSL